MVSQSKCRLISSLKKLIGATLALGAFLVIPSALEGGLIGSLAAAVTALPMGLLLCVLAKKWGWFN